MLAGLRRGWSLVLRDVDVRAGLRRGCGSLLWNVDVRLRGFGQSRLARQWLHRWAGDGEPGTGQCGNIGDPDVGIVFGLDRLTRDSRLRGDRRWCADGAHRMTRGRGRVRENGARAGAAM